MVIITVVVMALLAIFISGRIYSINANFYKEREELEKKNRKSEKALKDMKRTIDEIVMVRLKKEEEGRRKEKENFDEHLDFVKKKHREEKDKISKKLKSATKYKIYKFTILDENEEIYYPRQIVVISSNVKEAIYTVVKELDNYFPNVKEDYVSNLYNIEEILRDHDTVVLYNMDKF